MKVKSSNLSLAILSAVVASLTVAYFAYSGGDQYPADMPYMASGSFGASVDEPLHWHPRISIEIDGQEQYVPSGIGIVVGNVMDTDVSGMRMSPMHTHEDDGTIHMEQVRPTDRTVRLGYFFEVWGKRFDSQCIFDRCAGGGKSLRMFVNGEESSEFGDYVPRDGDEIRIVYG